MRVLRRHGGCDLGSGPGETWKLSRYDLPLLRDYVMDYGVIVDTFETATSWSNVLPLYQAVGRVVRDRCSETTGHRPYIGCHLSHLYSTGACVYFTSGVWGGAGSGPQRLIEQYWDIKQAVTSAILAAGGALSHHHAVGYEHQPWIEQEISPLGVASLRAVKQRLDPTAILNPGSLLPP
jgi:alkyldihydroxyacetonephosphate synthase